MQMSTKSQSISQFIIQLLYGNTQCVQKGQRLAEITLCLIIKTC